MSIKPSSDTGEREHNQEHRTLGRPDSDTRASEELSYLLAWQVTWSQETGMDQLT